MKQLRYRSFLSLRCSDAMRDRITELADSEKRAIAETARDLLTEGLKARGLA